MPSRVSGGRPPLLVTDGPVRRPGQFTSAIAYPSSKPVMLLSAPLETPHRFTSGMTDAAIFHRRWGWWPMTGWLRESERRGLIVLLPPGARGGLAVRPGCVIDPDAARACRVGLPVRLGRGTCAGRLEPGQDAEMVDPGPHPGECLARGRQRQLLQDKTAA